MCVCVCVCECLFSSGGRQMGEVEEEEEEEVVVMGRKQFAPGSIHAYV